MVAHPWSMKDLFLSDKARLRERLKPEKTETLHVHKNRAIKIYGSALNTYTSA